MEKILKIVVIFQIGYNRYTSKIILMSEVHFQIFLLSKISQMFLQTVCLVVDYTDDIIVCVVVRYLHRHFFFTENPSRQYRMSRFGLEFWNRGYDMTIIYGASYTLCLLFQIKFHLEH